MRFIGILVVAALLAAGCGSTADKNAYVESVNQAQAALTTSLTKITPGADGAQLDAGGAAIDKAARELKAITPPDDAVHAHGRMVKGLQLLAGTLHDAADAADAKDLDKLTKVLQDIQSGQGARELD